MYHCCMSELRLNLYNTLTHAVEPVAFSGDVVKFFICGPTVYGDMHAGHAKTYVQFDFLLSYMKSLAPVHYLLNITDIDDKIINKAAMENVAFTAVAEHYTDSFFADMEWLGNSHPTTVAKASEFIDEIVKQIVRLADAGFAYQLDDGWYFDALKARDFHSLANNPVAVHGDDERKHSSADFALWKAKKDGEPFWESVLGDGRPGWHVEDTAITETLFGSQYDFHGGAGDLIFPHHEAEIAIMETLSGLAPMAKHWVHTGLLTVDGAKMGKSLNNFISVSTWKDVVSPETIRYMFFSSHYRSSSEVSFHALEGSEGARKRVEAFYRNVARDFTSNALDELTASAREEFFSHLDNDFKTPEALQVLFSYMKTVNQHDEFVANSGSKALLDEINDLFHLFDFGVDEVLDSEVEDLIALRAELRTQKNFAEADKVRDKLTGLGIILEDTPHGLVWHRAKS